MTTFDLMSSTYRIDINCDLGESYGAVIVGNDDAVFPHITSCNIACGFHGGDPVHIEHTIRAALTYGVQIGAHPSYPDRENFGRKPMTIPAEHLMAMVRYQVAALAGMTKALGGKVTYVKAHGALYNGAADDENEATAIIEAIRSLDEELAVMGLPHSMLERIAQRYGVYFIREAFADRGYLDNGRLAPRHVKGAVIEDPEIAAKQVLSIILKQQVMSLDGKQVAINAQSICVHGDHPNTPEILQCINVELKAHRIGKRAFDIAGK